MPAIRHTGPSIGLFCFGIATATLEDFTRRKQRNESIGGGTFLTRIFIQREDGRLFFPSKASEPFTIAAIRDDGKVVGTWRLAEDK